MTSSTIRHRAPGTIVPSIARWEENIMHSNKFPLLHAGKEYNKFPLLHVGKEYNKFPLLHVGKEYNKFPLLQAGKEVPSIAGWEGI